MKYKLVNNMSELYAVKAEVVKRANESFEKDRFNGYGYCQAYITDKALAKSVWEKQYGSSNSFNSFKDVADSRLRIRTDKAQIMVAWLVEIYCNYRDGQREAEVSRISAPTTFVIYKDAILVPMFCSNKSTAEFYLFNDETNYKTIRYNEQWNKKPNRMGVITEKGIEAWYQYLVQKRAAAIANTSKYADKWDAYKKRILSIADKMSIPMSYQRDRNYCIIEKNGGSICRNGIHLKFEFNPDNGNICEKLRLDIYGGGIDDFIGLSDNKYTKK